MEKTKITGICMANVYTKDFERAYAFYSDFLGIKSDNCDKGKIHYYVPINDNTSFFLQGGYEETQLKEKSTRASFTFNVESASAMFKKLKDADIVIVQDEPMKMQENVYWFQCFDPDGNIVEFIGGE